VDRKFPPCFPQKNALFCTTRSCHFLLLPLKAENEIEILSLKVKLDLEEKVWSFWLVPKRQDVLDNHGHEQARLFMKTLDASFQFRWR